MISHINRQEWWVYSNDTFTYEGWRLLSSSVKWSYTPTFSRDVFLGRCTYGGKPAYFLSDSVKVMGHCAYCDTCPFEEDIFVRYTCARCGAPIDIKEYYK